MQVNNMTVNEIEHLLMKGNRLVVRLWVDDFNKLYEFSFDGSQFVVEVFGIAGGREQVITRSGLVPLLVTMCFHHAECQPKLVKASPDTDKMPIVRWKMEGEQNGDKASGYSVYE